MIENLIVSVIVANVVVIVAVEWSWFTGEQHSSGVGKTIARHRVCVVFVFVIVCVVCVCVVCVVFVIVCVCNSLCFGCT